MPIGNRVVALVLRSPFHRVMSRSTCLVHYRGRRSGGDVITPTQYARVGDDVVILVGRPGTKRWWRNFREEHPLELLIAGTWQPMTGRAILGSEGPELARPLLEGYLARFPRAARTLEPGPDTEVDADDTVAGLRSAVLVRCHPR